MLITSNFSRGHYRFTNDFLALESASPALTTVPYDGSIASPFKPEAWQRSLSSIPDKAFVEFLLRGISNGFRIGVAEGYSFQPAKWNLKSAYDHPEVVAGYLEREVKLGRLAQLPSALILDPSLIQTTVLALIIRTF